MNAAWADTPSSTRWTRSANWASSLPSCCSKPREGRRKDCQDRAVVLMNRSSSVAADLDYLRSIRPESYFPSPSHFVYTLPNIVTGEIAIRNLYRGETAFYILPEKDADLMRQILTATACDSRTESIIGGWVDYRSGEDFEADIQLGVRY